VSSQVQDQGLLYQAANDWPSYKFSPAGICNATVYPGGTSPPCEVVGRRYTFSGSLGACVNLTYYLCGQDYTNYNVFRSYEDCYQTCVSPPTTPTSELRCGTSTIARMSWVGREKVEQHEWALWWSSEERLTASAHCGAVYIGLCAYIGKYFGKGGGEPLLVSVSGVGWGRKVRLARRSGCWFVSDSLLANKK